MAYQALYRKYRPQTFSDVVGQEHITETLKNELLTGKTVHAYLFTGTRGTGKTSCAKILARAVNCLSPIDGDPCLSCEACLLAENGENTDIVEIDAASNNSVDSIRELRDQVAFAPSSSKYRVYIIDEVHMLTTSAFNALLKTLEEPPSHVVFILATTEVHKLPATILSRCQRFDFRRIEAARICERIQYIADKEGLTVTDGAAALIAAAADGGMRDALSILDLCASGSKNIDEKTVEAVCGMAGGDYLIKLADYINKGDTESSLLLIDKLYSASVDIGRLLSELTEHFRDLMIMKTVKADKKPIVCSKEKLDALKNQAENYTVKDIMYALSGLQAAAPLIKSGNRRSVMELTVIKLCNPEISYEAEALEKRISALEMGAVTIKAKPIEPEPVAAQIAEEEEIPLPEPPITENEEQPEKKASENGISAARNWDEVLRLLKTTSPLLWGVLRDSKAYIKGQYLLIDAPNSQFRTMINNSSANYKESLRKAAAQVLGETYKLGPYTPPSEKAEADPLALLEARLKNIEK